MLYDGFLSFTQSAIEAAILSLYMLDFGGAESGVVGAEWWVQSKPTQGTSADIGYHYDKDEAFASAAMTMRFPDVSTVTYLGNIGGPTLILNQTTPDGNKEVPELPTTAALVYPKRNKHLVFRGNLQHGVSSELALPIPSAAWKQEKISRDTLLVNWWREAPKPPNCARFTVGRWQRLGLRVKPAELARLVPPPPRRLEWAPMDFASAPSLQRVCVQLPPTQLLFLDLDTCDQQPAQCLTARRGGNLQISWPENATIGPIARFDTTIKSVIPALEGDERPKVFLVIPDKGDQPKDWASALPKWLPALLRKHARDFVFVLADPEKSNPYLKVRHLGTGDDAPTASILVKDERGPGGQAGYRLGAHQLRKATITKFLDGFLKGEVQCEARKSGQLGASYGPCSSNYREPSEKRRPSPDRDANGHRYGEEIKDEV